MKTVPRYYYAPTAEQKREVADRLAEFKECMAQRRTERESRELSNRMREIGGKPSGIKWSFHYFADNPPVIKDEFKAMGWSDSAAGELARIHKEIGS